MTTLAQSRAMALLIAAGALAVAGGVRAQEADEFSEAELFFELNDTDGDLGIHALIDGEDWRRLRIEDPTEKVILDVTARGRLRKHGLTELRFESAEPTFDEVPAEVIFDRFPEGSYTIEGITLDGGKLASEVEISHVLPSPPRNVKISGIAAPPSCDGALPTVASPIVISWDAVTTSHPSLGETGPVAIESYELIIELLDTDVESGVVLPPSVTSFTVSNELLALAEGSVKLEILARDENGNRTAVESCFDLD